MMSFFSSLSSSLISLRLRHLSSITRAAQYTLYASSVYTCIMYIGIYIRIFSFFFCTKYYVIDASAIDVYNNNNIIVRMKGGLCVARARTKQSTRITSDTKCAHKIGINRYSTYYSIYDVSARSNRGSRPRATILSLLLYAHKSSDYPCTY